MTEEHTSDAQGEGAPPGTQASRPHLESAPSRHARRRRLGTCIFLALTVLPSLLYIRPLLQGAIPYFMDTVLYFYPLRVHAAHLIAQGEWPLWNRTIMGGMPLFENPQAALGYPFNWPFLLWPTGFWFTFPMTLQLGLYAALTFWMLRKMGLNTWFAAWGGALCLAGGYGWSRLQYGNYMNVLPWWPLWLGSAVAYVRSHKHGWLVVGSLAFAFTILAGAHQLAFYSSAGFSVVAAVLIFTSIPRRDRWMKYLITSVIAGLLLGATGWLPQLGFVRETSRAEALSSEQVLSGAFDSPVEALQSLTGDVLLSEKISTNQMDTEKISQFVADAESSAWIGPWALALACVPPLLRRRRRIWVGAWLAALMGVAASLRSVMQLLIYLLPETGIFHDPRRWLGMSQWMLIICAALGTEGIAHSLTRFANDRWDHNPLTNRSPVLRISRFVMPCLMLIAINRTELRGGSNLIEGFLLVLVISIIFVFLCFTRILTTRTASIFGWSIAAATLSSIVIFLAVQTWSMTSLAAITPPQSDASNRQMLASNLGVNPGERFFTVFAQRGAPYSYENFATQGGLLPNLPTMWGEEDLGGYEPAQSQRYRDFLRRLHASLPWRQPYAEHFGLIQNVGAASFFADANVHTAFMPLWGMPVFFSNPTRVEAQSYGPAAVEWTAPPSNESGRKLQMSVIVYPKVMHKSDSERGGGVDISPLIQREHIELSLGATKYEIAASSFTSIKSSDTLAVNRPLSTSLVSPGVDPATRVATISWLPDGRSNERPWGLISSEPLYIEAFYWDSVWNKLWSSLEVQGSFVKQNFTGNPSYTSWPAGPAKTLATKISANSVDLNVKVEAGTVEVPLVVHDAYWPGWRATIDGTAADIEPFDLWRRIDVPPGEHEIVLSYRPRSIPISLGLSAIGALALAWLGVRRKPSHTSTDKEDSDVGPNPIVSSAGAD